MLVRRNRLLEAEAEVARLSGELERTHEALAQAQADYEHAMGRLEKERRIFRQQEQEQLEPRRGSTLARETLDLIRYGPLFDNTDPSAPRFSREEVEQRMRLIAGELEVSNAS